MMQSGENLKRPCPACRDPEKIRVKIGSNIVCQCGMQSNWIVEEESEYVESVKGYMAASEYEKKRAKVNDSPVS